MYKFKTISKSGKVVVSHWVLSANGAITYVSEAVFNGMPARLVDEVEANAIRRAVVGMVGLTGPFKGKIIG